MELPWCADYDRRPVRPCRGITISFAGSRTSRFCFLQLSRGYIRELSRQGCLQPTSAKDVPHAFEVVKPSWLDSSPPALLLPTRVRGMGCPKIRYFSAANGCSTVERHSRIASFLRERRLRQHSYTRLSR